MTDLMPADPQRIDPFPTDSSPHVCVPKYRAPDGQQALCWCGRDCRQDLLRENNVVNIAFARAVRDFNR